MHGPTQHHPTARPQPAQRGARGGHRRAQEAVAEQPVALSWASLLRATNMFVQNTKTEQKGLFAQGDRNQIHPLPAAWGLGQPRGSTIAPCPILVVGPAQE